MPFVLSSLPDGFLPKNNDLRFLRRLGRVRERRCRRSLPSAPDVRLSSHPAQAESSAIRGCWLMRRAQCRRTFCHVTSPRTLRLTRTGLQRGCSLSGSPVAGAMQAERVARFPPTSSTTTTRHLTI